MSGADTSAAALENLDQLGRLISGPNLARLTRAGALAGKNAALAVGRDLGPMRNMGRRGVRLSARYDVSGDGRTIVIGLRPPGPWVIAEQGAKTHEIRPRRRRARGAPGGRGAPAVSTPQGYVAAVYGAHARGRRGIGRAFGKARDAIPTAIHNEQVESMRAIFGSG